MALFALHVNEKSHIKIFDLYNLQLDAFIRLRSLETATYSLDDPVDELFSGGGVVWSAARQVTISYEFLKNHKHSAWDETYFLWKASWHERVVRHWPVNNLERWWWCADILTDRPTQTAGSTYLPQWSWCWIWLAAKYWNLTCCPQAGGYKTKSKTSISQTE